MSGSVGGWRSCLLSADRGWIAWTVRSEATDSPQLTHSILAVATLNGASPSTLTNWWRNCKHQLGEGMEGTGGMPRCPGVKMKS